MYWGILFMLFRILDVLTTHYHVSRWGYDLEANGIPRMLMEFWYPSFFIVNLGFSALLAYIAIKHAGNKMVSLITKVMTVLVGLVVFSNTVLIFL